MVELVQQLQLTGSPTARAGGGGGGGRGGSAGGPGGAGGGGGGPSTLWSTPG